MPLLAASTSGWISAISIAVLAVVVAIFTGWYVWMDGFRPRCTAKMDKRGRAMLLQVQNRGRVDGEIARVDLLDPSGLASRRLLLVDGYADGRFQATALPARSAMRLITKPPADLEAFPERTRIRVVWTTGSSKALVPGQDEDVDYTGMASTLSLTA
jgi:hypothetical protein